MELPPEMTNILFDAIERIDNNHGGHLAAELAIITLLIDAGIATIPQVCERLELIHTTLGERYQNEKTKLRTQLLIEWLRGQDRADGPSPAPDAPRWTPVVIEGGKDQS